MIGRLVILIVRLYQIAVSPFFGNRCRFYPSCSAYCIEAVRNHGCMKGLWLTLKRLSKCHPFHPGGVDFVPEAGRIACALKHE